VKPFPTVGQLNKWFSGKKTNTKRTAKKIRPGTLGGEVGCAIKLTTRGRSGVSLFRFKEENRVLSKDSLPALPSSRGTVFTNELSKF